MSDSNYVQTVGNAGKHLVELDAHYPQYKPMRVDNIHDWVKFPECKDWEGQEVVRVAHIDGQKLILDPPLTIKNGIVPCVRRWQKSDEGIPAKDAK